MPLIGQNWHRPVRADKVLGARRCGSGDIAGTTWAATGASVVALRDRIICDRPVIIRLGPITCNLEIRLPPPRVADAKGKRGKTRGRSYWVMAGLVPAIPIIGAPCPPDRDRRDKPGDDEPAATSIAPVTAQGNLMLDHQSCDDFRSGFSGVARGALMPAWRSQGKRSFPLRVARIRTTALTPALTGEHRSPPGTKRGGCF